MNSRLLPQTTPYDPSEDPPGSIDPVGTVTGAEQLAEVLFPGLTARMWRLRLLTYAALAAEIARRVAGSQEDRFLKARLAFERLFVSGVARQEEPDENWRKASRRLPGIGLARQAWRAGDQPLERANFLKGQAVNGPFGVISRLARDMGVVGETGELERAGTDLLLAWSEDQNFPGLLDDDGDRSGCLWLRRIVKQVTAYLDDSRNWPRHYWSGWRELADALRLDQPGSNERATILKLLSHDSLGLRERMVRKLRSPEILAIYRDATQTSYRGGAEKAVFAKGLAGAGANDEVERTLQVTVELIDAYETLCGLLESVFRGFLWGLTRNHGQAFWTTVVNDPSLRPLLTRAQAELGPTARRFQQSLHAFEIDALARKRDSVDVDRMHRLLDDSAAASRGGDECASAIMDRHRRVQKEKGKGVWIEDDKQWTLMPGFGDTSDEPLWYEWYLHPYRVTNMYSMLADLRVIPEMESGNAEEESE